MAPKTKKALISSACIVVGFFLTTMCLKLRDQDMIMQGYSLGNYAGKIIGQCEKTVEIVDTIQNFNKDQKKGPKIDLDKSWVDSYNMCKPFLATTAKQGFIKRKSLVEMMGFKSKS